MSLNGGRWLEVELGAVQHHLNSTEIDVSGVERRGLQVRDEVANLHPEMIRTFSEIG